MNNRFEGLKFVGRALTSTKHPLLAHLIVTRRCNLSCAYCNEYDKVSPPIPFSIMKERIKALGRLKTSMVTCTGGEPLLHPELEAIITEIRRQGMIATMITNGYLLTEQRIQQLNKTGLQGLQISIDNIEPDDVSYKSLKTLEGKLQLLAGHAQFKVNINSVLGISDERAPDAIAIAERASHYGFTHVVGILHDGSGHLKPLSEKQRHAYHQIGKLYKSFAHFFDYLLFQKNLINGKPNRWKCRAGARYLYICEDGLVHRCSQQRGYPGTPLTEYSLEDIKQEFRTQKDCSSFCTISCVHRISSLDKWRAKQTVPDSHVA